MIRKYIKENHYPLSCRWKKVTYNIFQMASQWDFLACSIKKKECIIAPVKVIFET